MNLYLIGVFILSFSFISKPSFAVGDPAGRHFHCDTAFEWLADRADDLREGQIGPDGFPVGLRLLPRASELDWHVAIQKMIENPEKLKKTARSALGYNLDVIRCGGTLLKVTFYGGRIEDVTVVN